MSIQSHIFQPGIRALAVVDFAGAGEAGTIVTIGGVAYTEADIADAPNGVWTNGASAATSATSFAAAINGDTRGTKPKVSAFVSDAGDSVFVIADGEGVAGNLLLTEDSATNVVVENMHGGADESRKKMAVVNYVVTDGDVLSDEVNIPLPFVPTQFKVDVRTTGGAELATPNTALFTIEATPDRIRGNFAGATDLVAGDIVHVLAFE